MNSTILAEPVLSYVRHEQWFELYDINKWQGDKYAGHTVKGKRIMNSYGTVREIWEDGTFNDVHEGRQDYLKKGQE